MLFNKNLLNPILVKSNLITFLIIIPIFFVDRITKIMIINQQAQENSVYFNDFLNFDLVWNTGIGFGLLSSDSTLVYNLISLIIGLVIIFLVYLIVRSNIVDKIFFSIVLGGALGNFYDRIIYYAVPDFIDFHYQNFHWFTFNVADIFITIGIIMLLFKELLSKK